MDLNMQKEQFSRAYIKAVAACAGFACATPSVDDDSVDMSLYQRGGGGTIKSPRLDVQIKCKAANVPVDKEDFQFSVKLKNYNELRIENVMVPRILAVVLVPDNLADWLVHSERELAMRHCGYWVSLRGLPQSENTNGETVTIPRNQQFTVQSLRDIMDRIGQGDMP